MLLPRPTAIEPMAVQGTETWRPVATHYVERSSARKRSLLADDDHVTRYAPQVRALALLLPLLSQSVFADEASLFLDRICMQGFAQTTMPKGEASRFCSCVRDEVVPNLNLDQRRTLAGAQADIARGRMPSAERIVSCGVRDLVVAGQARCEAAFYPPSAPINIKAGEFGLTLRCEDETKTPEAFIYRRGMSLLSKSELRALDARMMKDNFEPEYAKVTTTIDSESSKTERWEIDLTGEIVAPPNSAHLIERLRSASAFSISIERGGKRYAGVFQVAGKIPARWLPCGGVSR
jgi:hypothetical protein